MTISSMEGADLWTRRYQPAPHAATRLVCFPHAGGSASYFLPVSRALAPEIDVIAVQYPGRQDRRTERASDSIVDLADAVLPYVAGFDDKPLSLFGHSMGATLAFEVARRLQAKGREPSALFVSGRRAPTTDRHETVHQRDDDTLVAEIRLLNAAEAALLDDEDIRRMALPAIRSDYRAAETYRFQPGGPLLTASIHAHIGDSDPKASAEEVRAWSTRTTGEFTMDVYPGGHFYLNDHSQRLLASIRRVHARLAGEAVPPAAGG